MDRFTYMSDKENPRNIDILRESAEAARDAGVLCYIIDKALKVGALEMKKMLIVLQLLLMRNV